MAFIATVEEEEEKVEVEMEVQDESNKENLSTKIDEGNQAIGNFRFENTTFVKNVKTLDIELSKAHSQLERMSSSKLDEMLSVQKYSSDKASLGYDGSNSSIPITSKLNGPRVGFVLQSEKSKPEGEKPKLDEGKFVLGSPHKKNPCSTPKRNS